MHILEIDTNNYDMTPLVDMFFVAGSNRVDKFN